MRTPLAAIPNWLLSLGLHALLLCGLAGAMPGLRGGIVGDPDGDFSKIGVYVGHSGEGDGQEKADGKQSSAETPGSRAGELPDEPPISRTVPARSKLEERAVSTDATSPRQQLDAESPSLPKESTPRDRNHSSGEPIATIAAQAPQIPAIGPGLDRSLAGRTATVTKSNRATLGPSSIPSATPRPTRPGRFEPGPGGGRKGSLGNAPFFGIWGSGARFVYVIDCSGSMVGHNAIQAAKNELLSSVRALRRNQQFQIVFYNLRQRWLVEPGKTDFRYFAASEANIRLAAQFIAEVQPDDGTDHVPALSLALGLRPDAIFFLTDGGRPGLNRAELDEIRRLNQARCRIHCIQFDQHDETDSAGADLFLQTLARENRGEFRLRDARLLFQEGSQP